MSPAVSAVLPDPKLPDAADVVVIGGGIIGVATAWHLAKRGVSVAVCEKGVIAGEQSSRNWGYVRQQGRDPLELPLIIESLRQWRGLEAEIGETVGFRQSGVLYATEQDQRLAFYEDWLEHARPYQLDSKFLTPAALKDLLPEAPASWKGGLWTASDGRAEPALAAPAIARAAQRLGATLHTGTAVRGLLTEGGAVSAVVTERGEIRTRAVVVAGGAWSGLFLRRHGINLPQLSVRASVQRTTAAPELTPGAMSLPGFSLRRRMDGGYTLTQGMSHVFHITADAFRHLRKFANLYRENRRETHLRVGWPLLNSLFTRSHWALDGPTAFEDMRILDPQPDHRFLDEALVNVNRAFPSFRDIQPVERWAGMIDVTPDERSVISTAEALPGLVVATGFSGHGFGIGPAAGRLAAELATGAPTCVDPAPFRLDRF